MLNTYPKSCHQHAHPPLLDLRVSVYNPTRYVAKYPHANSHEALWMLIPLVPRMDMDRAHLATILQPPHSSLPKYWHNRR